jgi:hypothetical protein
MNKQISAARRHIFNKLCHPPRCFATRSQHRRYSTMDSVLRHYNGTAHLKIKQFDTISESATAITTLAEESTCSICLGSLEDAQTTTCNHTFCKDCYQRWFNENNSCPMCRAVNATSTAGLRPEEAATQQPQQYSMNRNALLNVALVDNHRIQHGNYPTQAKAESRLLLNQMNSLAARQAPGGAATTMRHQEWLLREYQKAISSLLQSGQASPTHE